MFTTDDIMDYIKQANSKMLGKTNRTIIFTRVNTDTYLDPDVPDDEKQETPSLTKLLPFIGNMQPAQFLERVREELTITSFPEFLDKFQPGFYYRVAPVEAGPDAGDTSPTPGLQFSLQGGPGWTKVRITTEHPYFKSLKEMIKKRVRRDVPSYRVDVDASLLIMKPRNQRNQMRKLAEDLQARYENVALQAKRDPASKDTAKAKEAYDDAAGEFGGALQDSLRVLPTVVYGLEQTYKELRKLPNPLKPVDDTVYQIEFGKNRQAIAAPRSLPQISGPDAKKPEAIAGPAGKAPEAITGSAQTVEAIAGPTAKKSADKATSDTRVAEAQASTGETGVAEGKAAPAGTAVAETPPQRQIAPIVNALDVLRQKRQEVASADLSKVKPEQLFAVVLSRFMDGAVKQGLVPEMMGNMLAVVLQDPKQLVLQSPDLADLEYYHDTFLGMYSTAVEDFLKEVTPLFEQIMGIYFLFNEFSADVQLSESSRPQVIIANAFLPDLFMTRQDELQTFFDYANHQAANQFQDAISFAVVPRVEQFRKQRPAAKPRQVTVSGVDDELFATIAEAQAKNSENDTAEGYDAVTYVDELLGLMEWGSRYGFQVLFSPEEKIVAGDASKKTYEDLRDNYVIEKVVDSETADAAVMCVPDFVLVPPDGKLITGRTATGKIEVGANVPQLVIRSCFVAAGRLMANDLPKYLERKLRRNKRDTSMVRMDVPGVGVDLSINPFLGETDLPTDHFALDAVTEALLDSAMPFSVFTHVSGRSPALSVPRTMRRIHNSDGTQQYRLLHLFRQQHYLIRLLRAAHELSLGGAFPEDPLEAVELISKGVDWIITFSGWHQKTLVNSFPSALADAAPFSISRAEGNTFNMEFGFRQGRIGELRIQF